MKIEAKNLYYSYGNHRDVLKNISFSSDSGRIFCILGPNGTGKSTLLNCLGWLLKPKKGEIAVAGCSISRLSRREFARYVGYVPQFHVPVFPYRVLEFVLLGRAPYIGAVSVPSKEDREIAQNALAELGIGHLASKPYTELSGGERQLVMFARALAQGPRFLLLDEPTSHLDFGNQERINQLIKSMADKGYGIIMTSHFPDHALGYAHQVGILKDGSFITVGPPKEVLDDRLLEQTYNIPIKIVYLEEYGRFVCIAGVDKSGKKGCPLPEGH